MCVDGIKTYPESLETIQEGKVKTPQLNIQSFWQHKSFYVVICSTKNK